MSGLPWLRLDDDGAVIEKVDPYEAQIPPEAASPVSPPAPASGGPTKGAQMTSPFEDETSTDLSLAALDSLLRRLDDTDDVAALLTGWEQARQIGDAAQSAIWHLAGRIGDALGSRHDRARRILPDGRVVEFAPGERLVWDRDRQGACLTALRDAAMKADRKVDPETGEVESPADVVCRVLNDAARIDWRSSVLKLYGVDPDKYSDRKAGRPSVRVIR